jgi:hypothetical protein
MKMSEGLGWGWVRKASTVFGQGRVPMTVVFQREWLEADQVRAQESAAGRVLWVADGREAARAGRLEFRGERAFQWSSPNRWWTATSSRPGRPQSVAIDLGRGLWSVGWTQDGTWGYGRLVAPETLQGLIRGEVVDAYDLAWLTQPVTIAPRLVGSGE